MSESSSVMSGDSIAIKVSSVMVEATLIDIICMGMGNSHWVVDIGTCGFGSLLYTYCYTICSSLPHIACIYVHTYVHVCPPLLFSSHPPTFTVLHIHEHMYTPQIAIFVCVCTCMPVCSPTLSSFPPPPPMVIHYHICMCLFTC